MTSFEVPVAAASAGAPPGADEARLPRRRRQALESHKPLEPWEAEPRQLAEAH